MFPLYTVAKELVCSMNRPSMKYFAHSGWKYDLLLDIYGFYFERTEPYKYLNDKDSLLNEIIQNRDQIIAQYKNITDKEAGTE